MDNVYDDIYVSNIDLAARSDKDKFETIITVCQYSIESRIGDDNNVDYCHYKMSDGPTNDKINSSGRHDYEIFKKAVDELISAEKPVLVHCQAGISRSPGVVVTAVAAMEEIRYERAYEIVSSNRPKINVNSIFTEYGKKYLKEEKDISYKPFSTDKD